MSIWNIDYKVLNFSRPDGIQVNYLVTMNDPSDLNENFLIHKSEGINSPIAARLFYWIDNKRWTLNEFSFFALNNSLCLRILNKDNEELASYGICEASDRIFGYRFGINFN